MTDYYSDIAEGYDELYGEEQDEKLRAFLDRVTLLPGSTLLDVGCGTGRSAKMLRQVKWQGLEPAQGLVDQAKVKEKITLASAENIPFPTGMFDVVLSLTAIQNFTDIQKGLEEIYRVGKKECIFLLSFLKKSPKKDLIQNVIENTFAVVEHWEQEKDMMFICRRKQRHD